MFWIAYGKILIGLEVWSWILIRLWVINEAFITASILREALSLAGSQLIIRWDLCLIFSNLKA